MRFVSRVLAVVAASTALLVGGVTAVSAAVVKAPGGTSSQHPVWDERAFLEAALDGEGLVFDILDVAGFAFGESEFDCANCDLAFSGLHESYSPEQRGGKTGGGRYGWAGPMKYHKAVSAANKTEPKAVGKGKKKVNASGSDGAAAATVPPSLTNDPPTQAQSFTPPTILQCFDDDCEPAVTSGTDSGDNGDGGSDGDGGGSVGGATVPEPGSMFLLGGGLIGLAAAARRRMRR